MFSRATPIWFLLYLVQINRFIFVIAGYIIIYPKSIWEEIVVKFNLNNMIRICRSRRIVCYLCPGSGNTKTYCCDQEKS